MLKVASVSLALVVVLSTTAAGEEQGSELVLRTQALEARRLGDWRGAVAACEALRRRAPLDLPLELVVAESHLALGDHARADASLERVLAAQPDHAHALYLSARVAEQTGQRERARAALLGAARAGRPVLMDLDTPLGQRLFGWVRREPTTVLALMRAAQAYELGPPRARRDPFAPPRQRGPEEPVTPPSLELQELEREVLTTLEQLDRLLSLSDPDPQRVLELIDRLSLLVEQHASLPGAEPAALRERLGAWALRHGAPGDLRQRVWLRLLAREGNRALLAMRAALDEERFAEVRERLLGLEELAARLRACPVPDGARLAEALLLRAHALDDEARAREELARLPLVVTGIVVPPPHEDPRLAEPASAIVDERLVRVGHTIPLPGQDEASQPAGPTVVAIHEGAVRFRYRGIELVRGLKARPRD